MKIPKPSETDKERFRSLVPDHPDVEVKPMFGNIAGFVNGNMFMGLFGPDVGVRLSEDDRTEHFDMGVADETVASRRIDRSRYRSLFAPCCDDFSIAAVDPGLFDRGIRLE